MKSIFRTGALIAAAFSISAVAQAGQFTVEAGKTKPLRLKTEAASVVLGNQNVADVAVHDEKMLLISGKSFGTTNLLVFDKDGNTIYSGDLVVTTNSANFVTVNRAGFNFTYNCAPECRDAIQVGDDQTHFNKTLRQLDSQKALNE